MATLSPFIASEDWHRLDLTILACMMEVKVRRPLHFHSSEKEEGGSLNLCVICCVGVEAASEMMGLPFSLK